MAAIDPGLVPNFIVGAALLILAAWLMILDPASRVNKAFALLLVLRGSAFFFGTVRDVVGWTQTGLALFHSMAYVVIPLVPATVYFLSVYPRPRGVFGTTRWGPWVLLAVTMAILAWYAYDRSTFQALRLVDGEITSETGALLVFRGVRIAILAFAGLVLSRDYALDARGSRGYSTFIIAAALTLTALFEGAMATHDAVLGIRADGAAWLRDNALVQALYPWSLVFGIGSLAYMAKATRLEKADATLQEARRFLLIAAPLASASGLYTAFIGDGANRVQWEFIRGFWNLAVPAAIAYALMRFSLFDVDIRLKAGVRRAIVLVAFTLVFFVVSEAAEATFGAGRGPWFGIAAAAILAAGARPLRTLAARAADRLMPDTAPLHLLSPRARETMYREQFLLVGSDDKVTHKERRMLSDLAEALHLRPKQIERLETSGQVRGSTKSPAMQATVQARPFSGRRGVLIATLTALLLGGLSAFLESQVPISDFMLSLISAAAITLLLGPMERLGMRLAGEQPPAIDAASLRLYTKELAAALSDGEWSRKDRRYLGGLAVHLGIDPKTRRRLTREALSIHPAANRPIRRVWTFVAKRPDA